jgi:hypothetical protein
MQILAIDHSSLVAGLIWEHLTALDNFNQAIVEEEEGEETTVDLNLSGHLSIGSKQLRQSFQDVGDRFQEDPAFSNFRTRLVTFLNNFLPTYGVQLPEGKPLRLYQSDLVLLLFSSNHLLLTLKFTDNGIQISQSQLRIFS